MDKTANAIITNNLIYEEYKRGLIGSFDIKKVIPLEFPNLVDYRCFLIKNICFDGNDIHCVFAGSFYDEVRRPDYLLKLISKIADGKKIVFHFFGNLNMYIKREELPNCIFDHGQVASDLALQYMMSADILINVGNTVLNQMPSKILTYISMGKPILNIIKLSNCPTLKYTKKYPLALDILETEEVKKEDIERVRNFIIENKGKEIPFETVEKLYYDCTPEYVGSKVYEIIEKVVNENK